MKNLLLTTALVGMIATVPLYAQTESGSASDTTTTGTTDTGSSTMAAVTPPEGYTPFEATVLTIEELRGATIYDANGESVGDISDFVFDSTTTAAAGADPMTDGAADIGATGSTDTTAGTDDTMSDTATTDTDADVAAGTDPNAEAGSDTATEMTDADGTASTGAAGTAADDGSVSTDATAEADTGAVVDTEGKITHVVLDVGGFLGIGAHTVAVPLTELQVFRDGGNDLRVYLPWTQEQLEGLPEFDANDPSTFQASGSIDTGTSTGTGT